LDTRFEQLLSKYYVSPFKGHDGESDELEVGLSYIVIIRHYLQLRSLGYPWDSYFPLTLLYLSSAVNRSTLDGRRRTLNVYFPRSDGSWIDVGRYHRVVRRWSSNV
jgi:hypothetical protein